MNINLNEKAEKSANYLIKTDYEHARLKANYEALNEYKKTLLATLFQTGDGGVKEREQAALANNQYIKHMDDVSAAHTEFLMMDNKRRTAIKLIDMWQTHSANERKGSLI